MRRQISGEDVFESKNHFHLVLFKEISFFFGKRKFIAANKLLQKPMQVFIVTTQHFVGSLTIY